MTLGQRKTMQKNIYLLELQEGKRPVNLGVFTSLAKAKGFIKTLPKKFAYAVYCLPTNTRLTDGLKDKQGLFDHWHFGTDETIQVDTDKNGRVIRKKKVRELRWPK